MMCAMRCFVHAYSTSRIFGIGKKSAFQKLVKSDPVVKSCAGAFILQNKSQEDISDLGKDLMVGGKSNDTLLSLCHIIFTKKVATAKAFVTPEQLPPTSPATRFHSLRVYFQIMLWMGMADDMNPTEWRWIQENNQFIPIMTEKIAAPDELLKIIHCNCLGGDANPVNATADAMDSPALLHVALAKLKTVTIQTTLKRSIVRRRMTLKTECS